MKKLAIFKLFLEKYDKNKKLFNYLSDSEIDKLDRLPSFSKKIDSKKLYEESLIDMVHYSWFIPLLNIYSIEEASLFLLVMKPINRKALRNLLNLEDLKEDIHPILKNFLKEILLRILIKKEEGILPIECLFESRLNAILSLNKNKIIKLVDFLSMYDLVKELKLILNQKKLKKIYSYLKEGEKKFLKSIMNHVEPFSSQKMMIEKYAENKKALRNILHMRGLNRLSIALSGESIDLIWYVCHYLDIGRGNYIFKECKRKKIPNVSEVITAEILHIINILKENKEKL